MKIKMGLTFAILLLSCHANSAQLYSFGVGAGIPYGGALGMQFGVLTDNGRLRGSIAILGVSAGYDYFITDRCSVGGTAIRAWSLGHKNNYALGVNCGLKSNTKGFNYGLDITSHQPDDSLFGDNDDSKTEITPLINFGYRF
ncbi:MAG: hypothetical protein COA42_17035 [Alteromonadaceae bacterium]|nr:MAG: hypothetical protein COA42_17035 [Alteromonadaceae bacterium]